MAPGVASVVRPTRPSCVSANLMCGQITFPPLTNQPLLQIRKPNENKMEEEDLYDDIFEAAVEDKGEENLDDLYENIHIPEVAETAISKAKVVEEENVKLKSQTVQLKKQISILSNINLELKTANTNLQKNLNSLVETSRIEINRKKNEISEIRKELDSILRNRAAKNLSKRDIEEVLQRARPKEDPFFECRLPVKPPSSLAPTRVQSGIRVLVEETKDVKAVVDSKTQVAAEVTSRQFVKRRKPLQSEERDRIANQNKENEENKFHNQQSTRRKDDISMISKYFGGKASNAGTKPKVAKLSPKDEQTQTSQGKSQKKESYQETNQSASRKNAKDVFGDGDLPASNSMVAAASKNTSNHSTESISKKMASESKLETKKGDPVKEGVVEYFEQGAVVSELKVKGELETAEISRLRDSANHNGDINVSHSAADPAGKSGNTSRLGGCAKEDKTTTDTSEKICIVSTPDQKEDKRITDGGDRVLVEKSLANKMDKESHQNQKEVKPADEEDVISFSINSEDELDYEAEEDTEEEQEAKKVEGGKSFVIPKVDNQAKDLVPQTSHLEWKEKVGISRKISDSKRSNELNTNTGGRHRDRGNKDENRLCPKTEPSSRSRSSQRGRKRSRSRKREETSRKTEKGLRDREGRGDDSRGSRGGRDEENLREKGRRRKELGREQRSPRGERSERAGRSRNRNDRCEDRKGSDQRKRTLEKERNGTSKKSHEPNYKKEKLEELDDDDLLNLRKELLKQMKAEDLEKLEAGEANIEDGEISDSGEEEVDKPPKSATLDPRARLRRNSSASKKKDGGSDKENTKEAQQSDKNGRSFKRISQDEMEIQKDTYFKKRGAKTMDDPKKKGLDEDGKKEEVQRKEEIEEVMRPELLLGFSTEDIDHKLIPFKKRQFKQLQFEEIQLKVQ